MDTEFKLIMERAELLRKNPELIPLQDRIDKAMSSIESVEGRLYYINIELIDSFYLLKDSLNELSILMSTIKDK